VSNAHLIVEESFLASPAAKLRAVCRVKSYTVGCRNLRPKV
jgi:hypothetical protein